MIEMITGGCRLPFVNQVPTTSQTILALVWKVLQDGFKVTFYETFFMDFHACNEHILVIVCFLHLFLTTQDFIFFFKVGQLALYESRLVCAPACTFRLDHCSMYVFLMLAKRLIVLITGNFLRFLLIENALPLLSKC